MMKNSHIHIEFDALNFHWDSVPEIKYRNFLKMKEMQANSDCFTVPGFPYMLQVEPTNLCNLKCPLCPAGTNKLQRKRKNMSFPEFRSLVDDMQDYLLFLILWEWGEPFMNPELPDMIRYAADRDIKTLTSTNAHFLNDEEYLERILTSGLSALIVAIDSLEQSQYEVYRVGGKLSTAVKGIEQLVAMKKKLGSKTLINLRMVIMKQNEHELTAMRKFAKKVGVDCFSVKSLNPSCGLDSEDSELVPTSKRYRRYEYQGESFERIRVDTHCRKLWFMCNIFADGEVVPCGYDFDALLQVGNINHTPLTKLWNASRAVEARRRIYYEKELIPLCQECTVNYKLSDGGWFPEVIDFNHSSSDVLLGNLQRYYDSSPSLQRALSHLPAVKRGLRKAFDYVQRGK